MTEPVIVVAAAIVRAGRLLVAERAAPADLAGFWELPGGKLRRGEDERGALIRECREELDVDVRPVARLGGEVPIGGGALMLRVWQAECVSEPRAVEHRQLAWVAAAELDPLNWLPADRPLIPVLRDLLTGVPPGDREPDR